MSYYHYCPHCGTAIPDKLSDKEMECSGISLCCECKNKSFRWHTRGKKGFEMQCTKCNQIYHLTGDNINIQKENNV